MKNCALRRKLRTLLICTSSVLFPTAFAQSNPPVWSATASYGVGDMVQDGGNYYRAIRAGTDDSPLSAYGYWQLQQVNIAGYGIAVGPGEPFPTLAAAWSYAKNAIIPIGSRLVINLVTTHGSIDEQFTAPLNLDQAFGSQISIIGDNIHNINLDFVQPNGNPNAAGISGIVLDNGHAFGLIENVNIAAVNDAINTGFVVDTAASLNLQNVSVDNFYIGVTVSNGARLHCIVPPGKATNSLTVVSFNTGIKAVDSSYVSCENLLMTGTNGQSASGILAINHSEVDAGAASLSNLTTYGFYSFNNSTIDATASSTNNVSVPYLALERGYLDAQNSNPTGYGGNAFVAQAGGFIQAAGSTSTAFSADTDGEVVFSNG